MVSSILTPSKGKKSILKSLAVSKLLRNQGVKLKDIRDIRDTKELNKLKLFFKQNTLFIFECQDHA